MGWGSVLVSGPTLDRISNDPALLDDFQTISLGQWDHDGLYFARVESRLIPDEGSHYDVGLDAARLIFRRADEFTPGHQEPQPK
jgi:hypothetical protein